MMKVYLTLLFLAAAVFAESVRETETWMPSKNVDLETSGDFEFSNEEDTTIDDEDVDDFDDDDDDDDDDFDDMSGSGDDSFEDVIVTFRPELDNHIPDIEPERPQPTEDETMIVQQNEIARSSSVQHNIFNKTELLAAVIAGGAVGLLFAILLILLLVYRMKKKDEGSYDLGKKPIYKKAPTTEIYA